MYNFGKFVRWDPEKLAKSETFDLCLLGKDPFSTILDATVAGESIAGRKIAVRRIAKMQVAENCSILFVSSSEENQLDSILQMAQRFDLLTVSDIPHFAERGGMIGFVTHADRIRFEVNRPVAERSHLILSSELLRVALRVIDKNDTRIGVQN